MKSTKRFRVRANGTTKCETLTHWRFYRVLEFRKYEPWGDFGKCSKEKATHVLIMGDDNIKRQYLLKNFKGVVND